MAILLLEDAHAIGDFLGSDALSDLFHALHDLLETKAFRGADPLQLQPFGTQSQLFHLLPYPFHAPFRPLIGIDIVAIADMAPGNKDCRSPPFEGTPDELFMHPARAHGPYQAGIRRVVEP